MTQIVVTHTECTEFQSIPRNFLPVRVMYLAENIGTSRELQSVSNSSSNLAMLASRMQEPGRV